MIFRKIKPAASVLPLQPLEKSFLKTVQFLDSSKVLQAEINCKEKR